MSGFKIGNFEIGTQQIYNALKKCGATDDNTLKKLDTNHDNKISEDELVELIGEDVFDSNQASNSSNSGKLGETAISQLQLYDKLNLQLEEQLSALYSQLGTAQDADEIDSVMQNISSVQDQLDANRDAVYNILIQAENQAAAASSNGAVAQDGYSGLTTGTGIGGGTEFGNSIVAIAQSYVGRLKESDGSYLKVTGGRHESWCADFVTYVVKQAAQQTGKPLNGFGSPSVSNLQAWGRANNCYIDVTSGNRAQKIVQNVKPGDVMIQKSNGASHTGIVTKVYSDGSFDTIEGNTSDQCKARHYSANDPKLSGFVKIT